MSEEDGAESVYRTIHDLPSDVRPRERLLAHGTDTLSAAELVAVVVGSGTVGENAVDLARRLMNEVGGLPGLVRADAGSLRRVKGLGPAKTAQILAAIELCRRVQQIDPNDRPLLITPEAVFGYMNARLRDRPREELHGPPRCFGSPRFSTRYRSSSSTIILRVTRGQVPRTFPSPGSSKKPAHCYR